MVWLPWTSDRSVAETSTYTTNTRSHPLPQRDSNPLSLQSDQSLRPHDNCSRSEKWNTGRNTSSECHFTRHTSHTKWPGIDTGPPRWEAGCLPPESWDGMALFSKDPSPLPFSLRQFYVVLKLWPSKNVLTPWPRCDRRIVRDCAEFILRRKNSLSICICYVLIDIQSSKIHTPMRNADIFLLFLELCICHILDIKSNCIFKR